MAKTIPVQKAILLDPVRMSAMRSENGKVCIVLEVPAEQVVNLRLGSRYVAKFWPTREDSKDD